MYNDDENRSEYFPQGAPSSDRPDAGGRIGHDGAPDSAPDSAPPAGPPAEGQAGRGPYYEPWQQPVEHEAQGRQEPFSPGLHASAYGAYQRTPSGGGPPPAKKKTGAWKRFVRAVCLVLVCALAGGGGAYGVIRYSVTYGDLKPGTHVVLGGDNTGPAASPEGQGTPTDTASSGVELTGQEIYDMAVRQVVGVNTEVTTNVFGQSTTSAVSGTGFVISADGFIATNFHVIQLAAEKGYAIKVLFRDGASYDAQVVGYDKDNDVAVIKIDAENLSAVKIGNTETMRVGDKIYAVGNPLGELDYTMTNGIVSALDRIIRIDESTSINMFQIDAAVNSGNSGGPVYNSRGEVLGIVSAKYSRAGVEGLGFAIPINDAIDIVTQIITNGRVSRPSIGVTVSTVTNVGVQYYGLPEGVYVEEVWGSCALNAGVRVGDVIVRLGDTAVTSTDELRYVKNTYKPGETATMTVNRDGQEVELTLTFDEEGVVATAS